ncbi:glycosyltransferase family 4 protein [Candidatus Saccharibacteria bacterium CPR2]|nr:glycosyltransferase family 4 protein [Candidatus Saccharibacteria bacterium CPR2]
MKYKSLEKSPASLKNLKVAIVCDWLTNMGGAERVVYELHQMFPDAPIYTSLFNKQKMPLFKNANIRTSFIQRIPGAYKKHQLFPLLREQYFENLNLDKYDLVISSSGAEAKSVKTGSSTLHINYCHSPTHYYWVRPDEYIKNPGFGPLNPFMRGSLKTLLKRQRNWDFEAAQRPDYIVANSSVVKERIKKFYNRDSSVIHPPVDIDRFKSKREVKRSGLLVVGRQVHYKRIDLAVSACTKLSLDLTVIGNGPEHNKLIKSAGPTIRFLTNVTDGEIIKHFQGAEGFIFPGEEDFGIVAVEALAAGIPVIAYKAGGALDYIQENKNGLFFDEQTVDCLVSKLKEFQAIKFDNKKVSNSAKKYSRDEFHKNIEKFILAKL